MLQVESKILLKNETFILFFIKINKKLNFKRVRRYSSSLRIVSIGLAMYCVIYWRIFLLKWSGVMTDPSRRFVGV